MAEIEPWHMFLMIATIVVNIISFIAVLLSMRKLTSGHMRRSMTILMASIGFILLANVAHLVQEFYESHEALSAGSPETISLLLFHISITAASLFIAYVSWKWSEIFGFTRKLR